MTIQVEISVQDCFYSSDISPLAGAEALEPPISRETWEIWFHHWLQNLHPDTQRVTTNYELSLRLTDDAEIQALNSQYRHQNKPTDVLAFAALEVDCPQPADLSECEPLYLGDIVISVDTANRQAQQQGHTLKTELAWLAAHGLLHLLGWDHPDDDSLTQMLNEQERLLNIVGVDTKLG